MAIQDSSISRDAALEEAIHQRDLLGQALGELLVHIGAVENVPLTGPELLTTVKVVLENEYARVEPDIQTYDHISLNDIEPEPTHEWILRL